MPLSTTILSGWQQVGLKSAADCSAWVWRTPRAPPQIAAQIYNQSIMPKMILRVAQGEPMDKTLAWVEREVEGFMRT